MEQLKQLFLQWAGQPARDCFALGANGSSRHYFRLSCGHKSAIGAIADDLRENEAFFAFARHFHSKGIPVPQLYLVHPDRRHYLQQDLGDTTLYNLLHEKQRQGRGFDTQMLQLYKQALADLAAIQLAGVDVDFSLAYPRPAFDRQSILWDLNYFKYHFLKLQDVPFDEQLLEDDFHRLADTLLQADSHYFLYRDFQARNIMVVERVNALLCECVSADAPATNAITQSHNNALLYYIDFQGGRRGAAQYDVASLLYSAKSNLPQAIRLQLIGHYLDVREIKGPERRQWLHCFWAFLLVRILQTLGAYGYRGLFQRKDYFLQSIPLALNNLRRLAQDHPETFANIPHLHNIVGHLSQLCEKNNSPNLPTDNPPLTVTVLSFSYKQGLPTDPSGNGGGFIFDCRALPNPGRYAQYKAYTGNDRPVIEFLQKEPAVDRFLHHTKALVAQSIDKYLERNFSSLQVAFGCTGGQHRSVYCAQQLAAWIAQNYHCQVLLHHREQETQGSLIKKNNQTIP